MASSEKSNEILEIHYLLMLTHFKNEHFMCLTSFEKNTELIEVNTLSNEKLSFLLFLSNHCTKNNRNFGWVEEREKIFI